MRRRPALLAFSLAAALTGGPAAAADWPQFRGPDRDGVSGETGLVRSWPESGPRVLWRAGLGQGYSGLAVVGGRLFTLYARGADEFAACLDSATGKELWRRRIDDKWRDSQGDGPRSTPTVDGGTVYALSAGGKLWALGTDDGAERWHRDLVADYGTRIPQWGLAGSPLVLGERLFVEAGGRDGALFVALDAGTGEEIWRSSSGKAGYAAPIAMSVGGRQQIVFFSGTDLYGVAPADGTVLWRAPWKTSWDVNAATPIFIAPDRLFVASGYDVGGAVFRIRSSETGAEVELVWKNREMKNQFSSSVLHRGTLYGFDNRTLKALDARSGETLWKRSGLGHGSLIYADGQLIVLGEKGQLLLVEATPEAYRELAQAQIFSGKTWTAPALAGGVLYLRDEKELVALDLSD